MKTYALTIFALALTALGGLNADSASAQNQTAILAETYGQGVHAYNGGRLSDALKFFSLAIDNGSQDPRVFYYRGIVNYVSGRPEDAEKDWQAGAAIEALGGPNPSIGRSLARFQGNGRLKLEQIRQAARIKALAEANARSIQRYGEIRATPENSAIAPRTRRAPSQPVSPPPKPPAAANPFAGTLEQSTPTKMGDDALAGAMKEPFDGKPKATAGGGAAAGGTDPFGGGSAPAGGGADPFGGGSAPAGGGADPFGGGSAPAGGGADPFGGGSAPATGGADPFGGDPFGG